MWRYGKFGALCCDEHEQADASVEGEGIYHGGVSPWGDFKSLPQLFPPFKDPVQELRCIRFTRIKFTDTDQICSCVFQAQILHDLLALDLHVEAFYNLIEILNKGT